MVTVQVGGADMTCSTLPPVRTAVGRRSVRDPGDPSTAAVSVEWAPAPGADPGAPAVLQALQLTQAAAGDRFTGRVSDARITFDDPDSGTVIADLTGMGPLASWGRLTITGEAPWPVESIADRAARIAAAAGEPIVIQGAADQPVRRLDVDRRPAGELLAELAESTGAFLFDHAGTVYLQALDWRRRTARTVSWDEEPAGAPWSQTDPGTSWDDETAAGGGTLTIGSCDVLWAPALTQTAEIANVVRVTYGPDPDNPGTAVARDDASIAAHGVQEIQLESQLVEAGDAAELAHTVLQRTARPAWQLESVTIDAGEVPPDLAAALPGIMPGRKLTLTGLPRPAPPAFHGVVEGWDEEWTAGGHTYTLYLSDVRHSMAVGIWDAEPHDETWTGLDPAFIWEDDL